MSRAAQQSITFVTAFNKCLSEWLGELRGQYPADRDFELFQESFDMLRKSNVRIPAKLFYTFVTQKYKDPVMRRDERFILQESRVDVEKNVQDCMYVIDKLKNYWDLMSEENKNANWKYMEVLINLTERIVALESQMA